LPEPPSQERSACSPGRPGDAHLFGLSAGANPRAALAARRGIFVRRRFSSRGRTVRAAGSRLRVARLLTVVACTPWHRRGTEATPWGAYRRPPTSCAHRLRKPDRTSELLALSVARRARGRGLHPRLCRHLPCQVRRCRRRFRTTATGRTRTPSVGGTRALQPERARHRLLFTRVASPRTLSLAASLGLPRQRPTGRLELSRAPACHPAVAGTETRVMPRERCVSPTSATDSRHEHPADRSIPGRAPGTRRLRVVRRRHGLTLGLSRRPA
jgi:hypothetical protein